MSATTLDLLRLEAGATVRIASWRLYPYDRTTAEVMTARAYAKRNGQDGEAFHRRAVNNGHDTAWTHYTGGALLGDASARAAQAEAEMEAFRRAHTLEPGQLVEIEGEVFRVRINTGNHAYPTTSDPIAFVPEGGSALA